MTRAALVTLAAAAVAAVGGYLLGRGSAPTTTVTVTDIDTVTVTATRTDTVRVTAPAPVSEAPTQTVVRHLAVATPDTVTVTRTDTVAVEVPRTQRHYADSVYEAWVSGYEPALDSLHVRSRLVTHTVTRTVTVAPTAARGSRWGLGVVAGWGVTGRGAAPFIGVAVTYRLVSF